MPVSPALNPARQNVQTFAYFVGSSRPVQFYSPHRPQIQLHSEGFSLFVTSVLFEMVYKVSNSLIFEMCSVSLGNVNLRLIALNLYYRSFLNR